jgi:hypothetical protein
MDRMTTYFPFSIWDLSFVIVIDLESFQRNDERLVENDEWKTI